MCCNYSFSDQGALHKGRSLATMSLCTADESGTLPIGAPVRKVVLPAHLMVCAVRNLKRQSRISLSFGVQDYFRPEELLM